MNIAKPWYQSKTIWIQILAAVATMANEVSGLFPREQFYPTLVAVSSIATVVSRLLTSQPIQGVKGQ